MRIVTSAMPDVASFRSQAPANRQGIDVFVETSPGKVFGVFDGVTVLRPKCPFL
jgi:hypothetical protein